MFALIISRLQRTPPENQAGPAIVIQAKSVQRELDENLRKRQRAENMIVSNPEVMRDTPVYRGTRIPVELIADMLIQGATAEEIMEGHPALDREKVELAPHYVRAAPGRNRPVLRPWAKRKPIRASFRAKRDR